MLFARIVAGHSFLSFLSFPRLGWSVIEFPKRWVQVYAWATAQVSSVADGTMSQFVGSAGAGACSGSMASTECFAPECNAPTTSTRSRRGVGGCTVKSLQSGDGTGVHGDSSGSRSERSSKCVVEAKQAAQERSLKAQLVHTGAFIETVTTPHPEMGSTRSRNGASEFSVAETRCAEHRI